MKRYYFDTSIFGGVYDIEFATETGLLFERVFKGKILCVYSSVTERELIDAPLKVRTYFEDLPIKNKQFVLISTKAVDLAQAYIDAGVVGKTSIDDCYHIAIATINEVDMLISWNFKHITKEERVIGYNSVNLKLGYKKIEICSPKNLIYEND
jgi:hypothetical protein